MTLIGSEADIERLATYGQFRGDRWGRSITYGKGEIKHFVFLEGVLLCYVNIGFDDEEEFIKSTMRIFLAEPSNDSDLGRWSFWFEETEVHCQIELIAPPKVFYPICQALATKRPDALYNIFLTTGLEKLSKSDNRIAEYSLSFIEK